MFRADSAVSLIYSLPLLRWAGVRISVTEIRTPTQIRPLDIRLCSFLLLLIANVGYGSLTCLKYLNITRLKQIKEALPLCMLGRFS